MTSMGRETPIGRTRGISVKWLAGAGRVWLRGGVSHAAPPRYPREIYTGSGPGRYTPLDPNFSARYIKELKDRLSRGEITFEQYRDAMIQVSHGVQPDVLRDAPAEHVIDPTTVPSPAPAPPKTPEICTGLTSCGPCFYRPDSGHHWHRPCIPGDTSEPGSCDVSACGPVPEGYACGTRQPIPSGYTYPCASGLTCEASNSAGGNYTGLCRRPPPASPSGSGEADCTGGPASYGFTVGDYTYAGFPPCSVNRHLTETDPAKAA